MSTDEAPKKKKRKREERKADEIVIPLVRPYKQVILAVLLFSACAVFLAYLAKTNDRGVIIYHLIHLGPDGADIFYAVLSLLSAGFVAIGVLGAYRISRFETFQLVLGDSTLSMPTGATFRVTEAEILFRDIVSVEMLPPDAPKRLMIHARTGSHGLPANYLPNGWTLREVGDRIIERARKENQQRSTG